MNKTEQLAESKELDLKIKLTKTITDLQQALEKAQKELEEAKKEKVWPQINDKYFAIGMTGSIDGFLWRDDNIDAGCKEMGNIFLTKEEAEHYRDYLKSPVMQSRYKLQKFADEYNGNWVFNNIEGYYCVYVNPNKIVTWFEASGSQYGIIRFKSEEGCIRAIEVLGEDVIKLACGVVE